MLQHCHACSVCTHHEEIWNCHHCMYKQQFSHHQQPNPTCPQRWGFEMNKSVCHTACHHLVRSKKSAKYWDTWIGRATKMKLSLPTEITCLATLQWEPQLLQLLTVLEAPDQDSIKNISRYKSIKNCHITQLVVNNTWFYLLLHQQVLIIRLPLSGISFSATRGKCKRVYINLCLKSYMLHTCFDSVAECLFCNWSTP